MDSYDLYWVRNIVHVLLQYVSSHKHIVYHISSTLAFPSTNPVWQEMRAVGSHLGERWCFAVIHGYTVGCQGTAMLLVKIQKPDSLYLH